MPEELTLLPLPCPACGRRAWVHYDPTTIRIYCPCCDILGPKKDTIEEARAAWNALPRSLAWTDEPPKVPGYYWWRNLSKPQVVHSNNFKNRKPHPADEWAGPIPEPREPKE